jgi:hypothetical protein
MKKTKTALMIVISILVLSILFYFVPFNTILGNIPLIKNIYNNTTLSINTKGGDANVTINGKEYGKTPLETNDLAGGEYTIILSKVSESEDFYQDHSFDIYLTQNTESRIDIEIGPNDLLLGTVLYYTSIPKGTSNTGLLTITSSPLKAQITLDGEILSTTPLSGYQLTKGQYTVKISKDGYEEVEAPVIIREGYHLNVKAFLFPIPLTLETLENEE